MLTLTLDAPVEVTDRYVRWRDESGTLNVLYHRWLRAPEPERARAFAAYSAQLDVEAHAAREYERATEEA